MKYRQAWQKDSPKNMPRNHFKFVSKLLSMEKSLFSYLAMETNVMVPGAPKEPFLSLLIRWITFYWMHKTTFSIQDLNAWQISSRNKLLLSNQFLFVFLSKQYQTFAKLWTRAVEFFSQKPFCENILAVFILQSGY